jgi:transposase
MEATSDYWKPFYYLLEDGPFEVMLVNARHVKNMPGRKSDVSDAAWLAQLGAHDLVRGSFVPPAPIRQLRDLTRARTTITRQRAREIQRLEKLLEDAGIKLAAVASDITGVWGRAMLDALVAGERAPLVLADLANRKMRSKIPELTEALTGRFGEHHAFLVKVHLDLIDHNTRAIDELTARIEVVIAPFRGARDLMVTIPGISIGVADVIIAETGADMAQFPTAGHLVLGTSSVSLLALDSDDGLIDPAFSEAGTGDVGVVTAVEPDRLDIAEQPTLGHVVERWGEEDRIVSVRPVDHPADRHPVGIGGQ